MRTEVRSSSSLRRKWLLLFGVAIGLVLLLSVTIFRPQRPLSPPERKVQLWLAEAGQLSLVNSNRFNDFGPDTIPYLVAALTNRSSRAEQFGSGVANLMGRNLYWRLPQWLRNLLIPYRSVENDCVSAERALWYTPNRSAVVSALVPLLRDPRDLVRASVATILYCRTTSGDTNWLPALVANLSRETNAAIRVELAWAIGRIDTNEPTALPPQCKNQ